ncbi:gastrula zinc finger protein XlCGF26.1-like [Ptychodera flava]|uniref:gastrula zinc finger protein XlCGF26.1-like n=1 Tax=Ptychodera flava TaxID=63121 RepID=UPI00396A13FB
MADNNSQSADSVMVEEGININRQQSNMDTQVAKWNDGIGDINGSDNDRKTCDPDTNQTYRYTEIGSCEETLQNKMELEGAEFWGKLKSEESCQQNSPIAALQNGGENESCSPDASTSNLESSHHLNRDTGNDETSDDDNSISDDTNQMNTLATSCNVSSVSGIEKPMRVRKKYGRAKKPPMTDKELETHKERIRKAMIGDKSHICEKCGKGYKAEEGLSLHMSLGICARQKCKYCGIDFLLKDWQNHMVDSHAEQIPVFPCRYCDRIFISCSSRSSHKFLKHSNGVFECDVCKHVFSNRIALNNHKNTHIERKFKCSYCDLRFTKQGIKSNHEKHSHSKVSAVCTECGETFDTRTHMSNHLKIVHSEHKFRCSYCDKKFYSKTDLKTHLESHGELSREYICKICKKVFYVRSEYRNHCMRDCTKPEYLCDICGRRFKRSTNLRLHALTHSEPTLKCDLCPRVFRLKTTLTVHVKSVHSDEKPWQCDVCGYRCKLKRIFLNTQEYTAGRPRIVFSLLTLNKTKMFSCH